MHISLYLLHEIVIAVVTVACKEVSVYACFPMAAITMFLQKSPSATPSVMSDTVIFLYIDCMGVYILLPLPSCGQDSGC